MFDSDSQASAGEGQHDARDGGPRPSTLLSHGRFSRCTCPQPVMPASH